MAHQMAIETQQELRQLPGNNRCVDCDAPYPQWATVSYGTFMCLECSGRHRGLGVHISFVRSVTMDSWTDKQIMQMQRGGNDTFREAFAAAGVPTTLTIQQKYNTPQAEAYRRRLQALVEGKPSVSLPRWDPSCLGPSTPVGGSSSSSSSGGHASGDVRGVEALKGESEQDYVARQMRLRDEARARMQAKFGSGGLQGIGSHGSSPAMSSSSAGGITDLSSAFGFLTTTVTSAASSAVSLVKEQDLGSKVSSGWSYVQSTISDPALTTNVKSTASTGWSAIASGATAVWKTAQTVVDTAVHTDHGSSAPIPALNAGLAPSGKYAGIGSDARDHDNDSWLDAQLGASSGSSKASSFGGSSSAAKPSFSSSSAHSNSFTSSSTSSFGGLSSKTSSPPTSAPTLSSTLSTPAPLPRAPSSAPSSAAPPVSSTSAPPPPPPPAEKKKDVDFFAEFGF